MGTPHGTPHATLHARLPATVAELPRLADHLPDGAWTHDTVAAADVLLARDVDLVHDGAGALTVVGHAVMRQLSEHPDVGNAPVEYLLGRSATRVRSTEGAAEAAAPSPFAHFLRNQVFTMNPPVHAPARRIIARHLMPRAVLGMRPAAVELARTVVDSVVGAGPVDLGQDLAGPVVTRFWTDQLGLPVEQAGRIQQLMHGMNRIFLFDQTAEDRAELLAATREYMQLVGSGVEQRWAQGDVPLLQQLAADLAAADLPDVPEDLGALVASNFFDGFHTVGVALTNAAYLLLHEPAALAAVRADRSLVAAAFTEGTRLAAPLVLTTRMALDEVRLGPLTIPTGTPITMIWPAGNRDPRAVPEPDAYRLDRPATLLTTFGGGARICPGRTAARMLSEVVLAELCRPDLQVTPLAPVSWVTGSGIRQLTSSPVLVERVTA